MNDWISLLSQPDIPIEFSEEGIYRAACIGAVMLLYEAGDAAALADTVRHGASPESRTRALLALENLTRGPEEVCGRAVHSLYELAILDDVTAAGEFIQKNDLRDQIPGWNSAGFLYAGKKSRLAKEDPGLNGLTELYLRSAQNLRTRLRSVGEAAIPNWVSLMGFLDDPSAENRTKILDSYQSFSPKERELVRYCAGSEDQAVRSLPADLFLLYDEEFLRELCLKYDLHPSDPTQEALFLFLSEQWALYEHADSEYRQIRLAYEKKNPLLQRRLIRVSRDSGNNAWLRTIRGAVDNLPHSGILSDQHLLAASLIEQKQWQRLWELLPNLPLFCMPAVCQALNDAGFVPAQKDEQVFFKELTSAAAAQKGLSPVPLRGKFTENAGTAVAVCEENVWFAAVFSDRRILVWDKRQENSGPVMISSNHLNFRKALISHDGKYLIADCGADGITVFSLPAGQAVKTFPSGNSALAGMFLQKDDRRLIVLGQNGRGIIYSFPGGTELKRFETGLDDCSRAAYDPDTQILCGISFSGDCTVYDTAGNRPLNGFSLGGQILASAEEFSRSRFPYVEKGESLAVVNLLSGKLTAGQVRIQDISVRRMLSLADGDLLALGTLDGRILIYDLTAGRELAVLSFGGKPAVTGIVYDSQNGILYGCTANGTVRSWDLGLFNEMIRTFSPDQLPGLNRIDAFVKKYPEPGVKAAAAWLKSVIAWRRRFDIEIEF